MRSSRRFWYWFEGPARFATRAGWGPGCTALPAASRCERGARLEGALPTAWIVIAILEDPAPGPDPRPNEPSCSA